jgi:hypothetical protein
LGTRNLVSGFGSFGRTERAASSGQPRGLEAGKWYSCARTHHAGRVGHPPASPGRRTVGEQVEQAATSTSKSAVSRRFVTATKTALADLLTRDLTNTDIKVLMVDGEHLGEHCCVVALAIAADGTKVPVGLWEGDRRLGKTLLSLRLRELAQRTAGRWCRKPGQLQGVKPGA